MEVRLFLITAVSIPVILSVIGSILCIACAIGIVCAVAARKKIQTKRSILKLNLTVRNTVYKIELFVIIRGNADIRERFTTPFYWSSVIRISENTDDSVVAVTKAVEDYVKAAVNIYNISVSTGGANKLEVQVTVTPVRA